LKRGVDDVSEIRFRHDTLVLIYRIAAAIKKQQRRFTDTGIGGKRLPFQGAQISGYKSYSVLVFSPERVDDTL
jgi:hypothetical protein